MEDVRIYEEEPREEQDANVEFAAEDELPFEIPRD
jgi:hypothetical protein